MSQATITRPRRPAARLAAAVNDDAAQRTILQGRIDGTMSFSQRVWAATVQIPAGKVSTYSAIAKALGSRSPRAVGQALHRNPFAPQVPCHRVVGSDGSLTGFAGGLSKKKRMLQDEGVQFAGERVDLTQCLYVPKQMAK